MFYRQQASLGGVCDADFAIPFLQETNGFLNQKVLVFNGTRGKRVLQLVEDTRIKLKAFFITGVLERDVRTYLQLLRYLVLNFSGFSTQL